MNYDIGDTPQWTEQLSIWITLQHGVSAKISVSIQLPPTKKEQDESEDLPS
jgi:hypothetical protein